MFGVTRQGFVSCAQRGALSPRHYKTIKDEMMETIEKGTDDAVTMWMTAYKTGNIQAELDHPPYPTIMY